MRRWRIIRGEGGNYKVAYYMTQEARDKAGQKWANLDGTTVIADVWDEDHPQDDLNGGWACDAVFRPQARCVNCRQVIEHEVHGGHGRPVVDVWVHLAPRHPEVACNRYDGKHTVAQPA